MMRAAPTGEVVVITGASAGGGRAAARAFAQRGARIGLIDVWVNNAMTSVFSPIKEMTADEFKRITEMAYLGFVYGTLAALRRMLPRTGLDAKARSGWPFAIRQSRQRRRVFSI